MIRRLLPVLAAAVALAVVASTGAAPAASSVTATTLVLTGHGYGHGVGFAQWGSYGYAKHGWTYDRILEHYFTGTQLESFPGRKVRVLLAAGASVEVASAAPFRIRDGSGADHAVGPGGVTVGSDLSVSGAGAPAGPLPGKLTVFPGSRPLQVGGHAYRGAVQVQRVGSSLQAVNIVPLDAYVRGVVTLEMPKSWAPEAIKAQAVASRTYALSLALSRGFLYTDTRDQVYGGIEAETPSGNAAVSATKGQVVTYDGKPIVAYFSSSSGGRTAALTQLIPTAEPVPYLVSVEDEYDTISPHHDWGPIVVTPGQLSRALGVPGVRDLVGDPADDHAATVQVVGARGTVAMRGSDVRFRLGLRSQWFTLSTLALSRPAGTSAPGASVVLTGRVTRVTGTVVLEQREGGGAWLPVGPVGLDANGAFTVTVTPSATTLYRLTALGAHSAPLRVPVAAAFRTLAVSTGDRPAQPAPAGRGLFVPNDPLAPRQWYLEADRAFDLFSAVPGPGLAAVKVAVIDTGIDLGHPEFQGRIAAAKSFVGGTVADTIGHGTFVAGILAAATDNGKGIAGMAPPAQLVVAKVVGEDGSIDPAVEAKAIHWAVVDQGARVVNLSLGGVRDPVHPKRDTFSVLEEEAIAEAVRYGALVVAAVGNGDQAPKLPWPYASYPAALPHVIGVSALTATGAVPGFSNRDALYNDIAAPGDGIVSTFPRALTAERPSCPEQGYSLCADEDYRDGEGTSFAAPQVSAAAALMLATRTDLTADQVSAILERSAVDVTPATGCRQCRASHDAFSGWGQLDVTAALQAVDAPLPPRDRLEPNDDAGIAATTVYGRATTIRATLDYWDDPVDVYRIRLFRGQRLAVAAQSVPGTEIDLTLWAPGTDHVQGKGVDPAGRAVQSAGVGPKDRLVFRVPADGWYFLEASMPERGTGPYTLRVVKTG